MNNSRHWVAILKKLIPRVLKASIAAVILYFLLFLVPTLIMSNFVPSEYVSLFDLFAVMTVFFIFITQLASGTILQYLFGAMRAIIFVAFFTYALSEVVVNGTFSSISILVDLRIILAMLIFVEFLDFGKNILETISYLAEKEVP
jgi:hypothetical protein